MKNPASKITSEQPVTILILGGTGQFGRRICHRLLEQPNIHLIVTSRIESSAAKLAQELKTLNNAIQIQWACLDQFSECFEEDIQKLNPDIVLHTAGPYQGQDYRVARACIDIGSHYIDLADGREFVEGFSDLNKAALSRNVLLVSGASTLPGLSSAVIDFVRDRFKQINEIEISIAPAHQTPRGTGTIAAVLSYCGNPFPVYEKGQWVTKYGWQDMRVQKYPIIGRRLSAACDVPDLSLLPIYISNLSTVTFHAALEAWWEQIALWMMGYLTRFKLVDDWARFVPAFRWLSDRMIYLGGDIGGMYMQISGTDEYSNKKSCGWHLIARQNHGPEIPCSPALVMVRKLIRNEISRRGAYACLGLFSLSEFTDEVENFDISWSIVD